YTSLSPPPPRPTLVPYTTLFRSDLPVGEGIAADEWDYRKRILLPDHCLVQEIIGRHFGAEDLPPRLRKHAMKLRQQFAALVPQRSEEHTSELQSRENLVCRLLLE